MLAAPHDQPAASVDRAAGARRRLSRATIRAEAQLDKLAALLARGTDRPEQAVPLIAALLGLPTEGRYPALDLTPQRQKQLTLAALVEQLEGLAAAQPVLLAYEDMHWSDPTTQELLGLTIERVSAPAGAAADHLPAGVQPAVACSAARQRAGALPARPARGRRPGRAGGPGQAAAGRGRGADRGQDRRRAAVRRGADQDGARIGPAQGRGRPLRAGRAAAAARAAFDPARLAARPPRPPRTR